MCRLIQTTLFPHAFLIYFPLLTIQTLFQDLGNLIK
jgi:hypothetical protein